MAAGDQLNQGGRLGMMYDGIICFGGEDWWYHNRGHYDMQLMQRFARTMPVLYVNSIGMRMPRATEGRMFLRRITRKLQSISRGMVRVDDNFAVCSPTYAPCRNGRAIFQRALAWQVNRHAQSLGMQRPLLWVACPPAASVIDRINHVGLIYQRTDRTECFADVNHDAIRTCDRMLKARANLTLFCTASLLDAEHDQCRDACLVDHGVDAEMFIKAGGNHPRDIAPCDLAAIKGPRVGFIGGIDAHTFDPDLMNAVAERLPDVRFALVGGCSLPTGWNTQPNMHLLGRKPYKEVAMYMAGCDVLIMPWNRSKWIQACNPIKLKEYLAVGRPIITTQFPEAQRYRDLLHIVDGGNTEAFARAIEHALQDAGDMERGRERVRHETWDRKAVIIQSRLQRLGLLSCSEALFDRPASDTSHAKTSDRTTTQPTQELEAKATLAATQITTIAGAQSCTMIGPRNRTIHQMQQHNTSASLPTAIIMLAGGTQRSALMEQTGLHPLDLHITQTGTLLDCWLERLADVCDEPIPIRIITSPTVTPPWPHEIAGVTFECDREALRGSAGALHDACERYNDHDHVLITQATALPPIGIREFWLAHVHSGDDITIGVDYEHTPIGVMAMRSGVLRSIPQIGYADLREQWLPRLTGRHARGRAHIIGTARARWIHDRQSFLDAVKAMNGHTSQQCSGLSDATHVICDGALVDESAVIHDSVIMPGAHVAAGAIVARSVVCSGQSIQVGLDLADAILGAVCPDADHPHVAPSR